MKQLYKLIFFCLATVFIMACQNDESEIPGGEILKEVTFSASQTTPDSLFTRATDLAFSPGDEIGIYVVKRSNQGIPGTLQDNGNYAHNKRYKIDNNGQLKPYGENDKIYLSGADTYDFYAYYPYQSYISNPNAFYFNVFPDQSTAENYTKYDFMLARNLTGQNTNIINLQFQRKFALIETYFEKIPGKTVTKATLYNRQNSVLVNIGNNTVTPAQTTTNITMLKQAENEYYYTFRAIVPVQDIPANECLFTFVVDGKNISYKATTATPLAPGKKSTYLVDMQYRIYALTANVQGGSVTGAEKIIFRHGERIDLVATPAADYTFSGFYDSIEEKTILLSNNPVHSFFANKDMRIYGYFTKVDPTYNISATATQGGTVTGGGQYKKNSNCILTATAEMGYTFAGWYENDNILTTSNLSFNLTAISDRNFTARFTPNDNIITIWRGNYVTVTGSGGYKSGRTCTLTATMYSPYYAFGGYWDESDQLITMSPTYNFIVNRSRNIKTQNHPLTHFFYNHSYWFNRSMESSSQTTLIQNEREYQAYTATLKAGEKARYESVLVWNESTADGDKHKNTMQITGKTLTIKQNGRVIATTNQPDNYIFTAPVAGNYDFIYTGRCQVVIYAGEKCVGYLHITAALWKEETIH